MSEFLDCLSTPVPLGSYIFNADNIYHCLGVERPTFN